MRTVVDLFSGIGGFALAVRRSGYGRVVSYCEIDPFCRLVLQERQNDGRLDAAPIFGDIREFDPEPFQGADLVVGGFPCQDISSAGKRAGIDGARSGLWSEMARIIAGVRPTRVLIENVAALRTRGADRVLSDLDAIGYAAWPLVVGAWSVGAPHKRERVWIVAVGLSQRRPTLDSGTPGRPARSGDSGRDSLADSSDRGRGARLGVDPTPREQPDPPRGGEAFGLGDAGRHGRERGPVPADRDGDLPATARSGAWDARRADAPLADADRTGQRERGRTRGDGDDQGREPLPVARLWPARPGEPQHEWEEPRLLEQPVGRTASGISVRLVRRANREALRAYGNAIVPQVAEAILRAMLEAA